MEKAFQLQYSTQTFYYKTIQVYLARNLPKIDQAGQMFQQVKILIDLISKGSMATVMNTGDGPELIQ